LICLPYHERVQLEKIQKRENFLSGEKSEGEEKMYKCYTGLKNPPLRKEKGIKREE
jgi:hypothetical protein